MYMHGNHQKKSCIRAWMSKLKEKSHQNECLFCRMVLEQREREHEDVDRIVHGDINAQQALKGFGLCKFWQLGGLRTQPRLL